MLRGAGVKAAFGSARATAQAPTIGPSPHASDSSSLPRCFDGWRLCSRATPIIAVDGAVSTRRRAARPASRSNAGAGLGRPAHSDARRAAATAISRSRPASTAGRIDFMVDTGASLIALRESDAARLGIHPRRATTPRSSRPPTARSRPRRAKLDRVEVGGIIVRDVAGAGAAGRGAERRTCSACRSCRGCGATNTPTAGWCWSSRLQPSIPRANRRAGPLCAGSGVCAMLLGRASARFEDLMFPTPKPALTPNTYAYESEPLVKPTGFREYDARWLLGQRDQPDGRAGARAWGSAR